MRRLFVPGWGAPAALYTPLVAGWEVVDPPGFAVSNGRLDRSVERLLASLEASGGPAAVAGHSMGAAVAVLAAADRPDLVERLVLIGPAGLPLVKPMRRSAFDFIRQLGRRTYPVRAAAAGLAQAARAPGAALRLAQAVHQLDLTPQLADLKARSVRCQVIGCASDTLTPTGHCRRLAELVGGSYRELDLAGGHMWMLYDRSALASALS
jgi:pimeloyl-ACP methyl ester carboxylesterase